MAIMNFMEKHHNAEAVQDNGHNRLSPLARNQTRLAAIRTKLACHRDTRPLFDTARFTRNFEAALATMQARRQNGEPPADFAVA
jgi:hypothetical protein